MADTIRTHLAKQFQRYRYTKWINSADKTGCTFGADGWNTFGSADNAIKHIQTLGAQNQWIANGAVANNDTFNGKMYNGWCHLLDTNEWNEAGTLQTLLNKIKVRAIQYQWRWYSWDAEDFSKPYCYHLWYKYTNEQRPDIELEDPEMLDLHNWEMAGFRYDVLRPGQMITKTVIPHTETYYNLQYTTTPAWKAIRVSEKPKWVDLTHADPGNRTNYSWVQLWCPFMWGITNSEEEVTGAWSNASNNPIKDAYDKIQFRRVVIFDMKDLDAQNTIFH